MFRCWRKWALGLTLMGLCLMFFTMRTTHELRESGLKRSKVELQRKRFEVVTNKTYRIVHFDFKGAPPRLSYLREVFSLIAANGGTGILLEYEDMFPYTGRLANLSARNSYTKNEVKTLLSWAHDLNLEVIPLIQTFGHMEFVLKLEEFRSLREEDMHAQAICPSKERSYEVIGEIMDQILALHPGSKFIHIGCDEVFQMNTCPLCTQRQLTKSDLYTQHVLKVAQMVKERVPGIRVLIWDDMIRSWGQEYLFKNPLTKVVEPVAWVYARSVEYYLPYFGWFWYGKSFSSVWIAPAYKGAELGVSLFPNLTTRYINHKAWLTYVEATNISITGIVLSGWSRFDHFAVLCELYPASIPSLVLNLLRVAKPKADEESLFKDWLKVLNCPHWYAGSSNPGTLFETSSLLGCEFPGDDLYKLLHNFENVKSGIDDTVQTIEQSGRGSPYNFQHNYTNVQNLQTYVESITAGFNSINSIRLALRDMLKKYFDQYTVNEWIEQKVDPLYKKLKYFTDNIKTQSLNRVWPRRPI